jgi:Tol biopolymer transport system component
MRSAVPVAVAALALAVPAGAVAPPVTFVAASYGNVVLLTGTGEAVRSFGPGESPAWSADGKRIAFVRGRDVFTVGADGTGLTRVTRTAAIEESPDWGPDGSLVYASNRGGTYELYVQKPGAAPRRLTHTRFRWQEDRAPAWSPDGRWVAFSSTRPGFDNAELYRVRPDGTGLQRLTFTGGTDAQPIDDGMPTWRPDGRGIVFVSNRDGNLELYALDPRTRKTVRMTSTPQDETLPRVGLDGRYAFVVPVQPSGSRISIATAALTGRRVIQAGDAVDWRP